MLTKNMKLGIIAALIILTALVPYYFYIQPQSSSKPVTSNWQQVEGYLPVNQSNLAYYAELNAKNTEIYYQDVNAPCNLTSSSNANGNIVSSSMGYCYRLEAATNHQEHFAANINLLNIGFFASCLINCNGVTYYQDPTVVITNYGRDFEQCKIFNASGTITCVSSAADKAVFMGISSATGTISATNTTCSGIISSGGLTDIAGTFTAGAAGTSVTSSLTHTWTAAETDTAVQVFCQMTELHTGAHPYPYLLANFGPDTLVSGNTIQLTSVVVRT